ncbi:restriction endonuclease subunit S [Mycobacterium sp. CVI_P3]|uniref:Restriction endonuclease subunit S n=1 Tax=Mycobacterium pinniadriaticum TaxID=2994102 RepID=A0ABT3SPI4_9MYCO|nr:restriction endonuclease subunit S [Mycobacterium pinniadriaticum]MCX2934941.1 restriction endonuclease subunit S [Mycobacterium pinniadriaticum]MCX2941363.1 restriction endonuclease subunit S [Mycobacterium pinniadriaticum]
MTLPTVPLASIAEVKLGRQRSPQNHTGPTMRKYLRAANVGWSGLLLEDVKSMNFSDSEMATFRLGPGDILLNEASGSPTEVGKPAIWKGEIEDCGFQNTLLRVRCGSEADPQYLLHYFRYQAATAAFARGSRGVGIHHLGREALAKWPVPLPPLNEQHRIAAILDRADATCAKRRSVVELTQSLGVTIFLEMFGDPDKPRAGYRPVRFGEIADLQGGRNLVAEDSVAQTPYRVLKISAVTSGKFKPWEAKPLPADYAPPEAHLVRPGDLLISRANTAELVGAVAYVPDSAPNLVLPDKIWRFIWKDPASVPLYYWALLSTPALRRRISRLSSGTGGSMKNISKAKLQQLELPYADPVQQREFQRRVAAIPTPSIAEFDELVASLQSRAFSGQL